MPDRITPPTPEVLGKVIIDSFYETFMQKREWVIKEVMQQVLKREPTIKDAEDFSLSSKQGDLCTDTIYYKGLALGTITTTFKSEKDVGFYIEFNPKMHSYEGK